MSAVRTLHLSTVDAEQAVRELRAGFADDTLDALLFFCSSRFDLQALADALAYAFADVPCVVGCTTAGQIGPRGFEAHGFTAIGFRGGAVAVTPYVIEPLSSTSLLQAACDDIGRAVEQQRRLNRERGAFGLLLVDGLCKAEEQLTAALYGALGDIPIVGGSAGDDYALQETAVYSDGSFRSDRAVFLLCETALPFETFRFQHVVPTTTHLVVTRADPERRIVYELNGLPALQAYAAAVGVAPSSVTSATWAAHPLLVSLGGEAWIRSIERIGEDNSLELFCAIDEGVPLRLGETVDAIGTADAALSAARTRVPGADLVLGCDSVLRRLECEAAGTADEMGTVMARHGVVGFCTYGEQWNSVHLNQTFTGLVLGGFHG
jgi:hypothetical protein